MDTNAVKELAIQLLSATDAQAIRQIYDQLGLLIAETPGSPAALEVETCYGCGGATGPNDPRQANARAHGTDASGLVTAVWLTVHTKPSTRYRCVNAYLIDEHQAKGQTVILIAVKRKDGTVANERVLLATGYNGNPDKFDDLLEPGNAFVPVQHIMADAHTGKGCSFFPPDLGPLAIFVAGANDRVDSDVVGNLGLPGSHHVSFMIEYQER